MMTRTLAVAMLLAPRTATMTMACPWAIVPAAVAGVNVRRPSQVPNLRKPAPPPQRVAVDIQRERTPTPKPADLLVYKDDAWRSVASITPDVRARARTR